MAQSMGITERAERHERRGRRNDVGAVMRSTTSSRDTLNWQKGAHSISLGGAFTQFQLWQDNQTVVPELRFGVVQGDPAEAMFDAGELPGRVHH